MARVLRVLVVVVLLGTPHLASAQVGAQIVQDPWLLAQALKEVAQSLQMINLVTRDLEQWSTISSALAIVTDVQVIIQEVDAIAARIRGRQSFWGSQTTFPDTLEAFGELRRLMTLTCRTSSQDALLAQDLVSRLGRILGRLENLVQNLSNILGSVAGLQSANVVLSELNAQLTILAAVSMAANEAQLCPIWANQVAGQALEQLQFNALRDYGVVPEVP
jgi:hypothetical protein